MNRDPSEELLTVVRQMRSYVLYQRALGVDVFPRSKAVSRNLADVREELGECQRCPLWKKRRHLVFGEGNEKARLVFVGEAPGYEEDSQGRPFVGKAGQLLTRIISAMGMTRDEVYITNVVKCRPPQNRVPTPGEIVSCYPFLAEQLRVIRPKVICALGGVAAQVLLDTDTGITALRGVFHSWEGIRVMPTFHPAYLLRNPDRKRQTWEDMQTLQKELHDGNP